MSCIDLYISVSSIVYRYTYSSIQYPRRFSAIIRHCQLLFSSIQYHISVYIFQYFNLLPLIPFKYPVLFILCNFQCAVSYFFIQYFVHFLVIRIINLYTCYNISYLYSQFIYILLLISSILSFKYLVSLSPVHITMFIFQYPVS